MKKLSIILAVIMFFICVGLGAIFGVDKMLIHNAKLSTFQQSFITLQHPESSILLATHKEFGNFGNSNHCDYLVGEFRSSPLPFEQIQQYYSGKTIPAPDTTNAVLAYQSSPEIDVEVSRMTDAVFQYFPWSEWLRTHESRLVGYESTTYFAFASAVYPPDRDIRCH